MDGREGSSPWRSFSPPPPDPAYPAYSLFRKRARLSPAVSDPELEGTYPLKRHMKEAFASDLSRAIGAAQLNNAGSEPPLDAHASTSASSAFHPQWHSPPFLARSAPIPISDAGSCVVHSASSTDLHLPAPAPAMALRTHSLDAPRLPPAAGQHAVVITGGNPALEDPQRGEDVVPLPDTRMSASGSMDVSFSLSPNVSPTRTPVRDEPTHPPTPATFMHHAAAHTAHTAHTATHPAAHLPPSHPSTPASTSLARAASEPLNTPFPHPHHPHHHHYHPHHHHAMPAATLPPRHPATAPRAGAAAAATSGADTSFGLGQRRRMSGTMAVNCLPFFATGGAYTGLTSPNQSQSQIMHDVMPSSPSDPGSSLCSNLRKMAVMKCTALSAQRREQDEDACMQSQGCHQPHGEQQQQGPPLSWAAHHVPQCPPSGASAPGQQHAGPAAGWKAAPDARELRSDSSKAAAAAAMGTECAMLL